MSFAVEGKMGDLQMLRFSLPNPVWAGKREKPRVKS